MPAMIARPSWNTCLGGGPCGGGLDLEPAPLCFGCARGFECLLLPACVVGMVGWSDGRMVGWSDAANDTHK